MSHLITNASMSTLTQHFGREVKVYEIKEYGKTYFRLFYRSTGTGNENFGGKFADTLVPFYSMMDDENKTLIKAIMIRNKVHDNHKLFTWQVDLLQYLSEKTDSLVLGDVQTLLDNYFNTPSEILISINDRDGFWKNNTNIAEEIIIFFEQNEYEIDEINEIQDFDINNDTNELHNIENDKKKLRTNWHESFQIVAQKEQEERLNERLNKTVKGIKRRKTNTGGKKMKRKTKKGGKKMKRRTKKSVKGKKIKTLKGCVL